MDGIIIINKEKGLTSRDVVNLVGKKLNTRKVGHAGTLDPMATGVLVIGVGKGTKVLDLLTMDTKEYIATAKVGIETDTYDITGNVLKTETNYKLEKDLLENTLNTFLGSYNQVVPKYSAVKINGKKLYEYARNNLEVTLPERLVTIYKIELLNYSQDEFTFKVLVSKGTYIRSLVHDIGVRLNIPMTLKELVRTKSGKFELKNSNYLNDDYKFIKIQDALDYPKVVIKDLNMLKRVKNGNSLKLDENSLYLTILDDKFNIIAIYKKEKLEYKAFKVF